MKKYLSIVLLLLVIGLSVKAQKRDTTLFKQIVVHGLDDTKAFLTSPLSWEKKDWLVLSGFTAATGALIIWGDQPIYDFNNRIHTNRLDAFYENIEPLGNIYSYMAIGAIMLKGFVQKDNYAMETAFIAMESFAFTGVYNRTIKTLAGRNRPNYENTTNPHQWYGPFIENPFIKKVSFFSGHTTTAFSIASVFAYRYKDDKWVPYVAYGLASLGGIQRIYNNRHWASDVLVGAAIGTATGIFLSKQWEENSIRFYPTLGTNGASLSLVIPIE
ncbi:MAG: phosphatase PAP2 family protein [Prolixibacteraceae bacterium]|jgi:membrane-associated phospholipid phosphatase|nr:phosphatase PAP2 family protein [Prolixibacteraceae bacterium]